MDYREIIDNIDYDPTKKLSDIERNKITKTIISNQVILAAGSIGSTEILLKCKNKGSLKISSRIGQKSSSNGDLLGVIVPTKYNVEASRGPVTTSIARFKDKTGNFIFSIEDEGIPKMFAEIFATIFRIMLETNQQNSNPNILPTNMIELFNNLFKFDINYTAKLNQFFRLIEGIDISTPRFK